MEKETERAAKGCTHPADEPCFGNGPLFTTPESETEAWVAPAEYLPDVQLPPDDNSGDGWFDSPELDGIPLHGSPND